MPVSQLREGWGLPPSVFYPWQRQVFDNLGGALTTPPAPGPSRRDKEMPRVEVQLVDVGEIGVPAIAPAVANALVAAGVTRVRRLPLLA